MKVKKWSLQVQGKGTKVYVEILIAEYLDNRNGN